MLLPFMFLTAYLIYAEVERNFQKSPYSILPLIRVRQNRCLSANDSGEPTTPSTQAHEDDIS